MKQGKKNHNFDYMKTPLWNVSLPLEERLNYLISELTLEEKIQCLTVRAPKVKRLGIKSFMLGGEAAHGVEARHDQDFNIGKPIKNTVFTQPIGMSATWDILSIEQAGVVTGTEARAIFSRQKNIGLSRWAPTVDMERDPRWGRTEEGYGEDPYLTGKMSSAYIQGLQGRDSFYLRCGATIKHFYANNEEKDRIRSSSSIDVRNKYEYYLEPFRRAIVEGKAEAVMTSYNEINGIPAIVNDEVRNLIKNQWCLRGHVVCDMGDLAHTVEEHKFFISHAESLAAGLKCGIDSFNDPEDVVIDAAREALHQGLISVDDIDNSIRNTFSTKIRLGLYDSKNQCPYVNITERLINCEEHQDICLNVAKKAIILLKNNNRLLPLNPNTNETILVVGPLADAWYKDWYSGLPLSPVSPMNGILKTFQAARLLLSDGIDRIKIKVGDQYLGINEEGVCILSNVSNAEVFEHTDWGYNKHTLRAVSNQKYLSIDMDGKSILANQEEVFSWYVKEAFSFKELDNKGGKDTPLYMIRTWNDLPLYVDKEGKLQINNILKEYTEFCFEIITNGIEKAVEDAKLADKVIAVMGCHPIISCKEETDREDLYLPLMQQKLLKSIKQVNANIILVLITNYPYAIDWEKENIPAILMTASGSQELGNAIALAVAGEYSPAGRLNMTWYNRNTKLPLMRDYDIIHGKRTYQYFDEEALYPFGYGLSYTEFFYYDLQVHKELNYIDVKLRLKNIGACDGEEVVQLYVKQLKSRAIRPNKQLKGFQRIYIKALETADIHFVICFEELQYYDVVSGTMLLEDSDYCIQIGASSQDIRLETTVHVQGEIITHRDMTKAILCDHYDSYENIYLHRGHDGKPCMVPKTTWINQQLITKGTAIYHDVKFEAMPKLLRLDVKAEELSSIIVWHGELKLANMTMDIMEDFKVVEIPIKALDSVVGINKSLKIEIQGRMKVVDFLFQK